MKIKLGKIKQIELTAATNISRRLVSSHYTITGRDDLKLFNMNVRTFDERYGEWFDEDDYIEFWADSYENCFTFLKETVNNYLSCFDKNTCIEGSPLDFWNIDNIEQYLSHYIPDGNYIEISKSDTQKELIIKCNDATEKFHYSLRKTSELVHKLQDVGILVYLN